MKWFCLTMELSLRVQLLPDQPLRERALPAGAVRQKERFERIEFDNTLDIKYSTIGNAKPIGICGSAIIDFIAEGMRSGLVNMMGRYDLDLLKSTGRYHQYSACGQEHHACLIAEKGENGNPIVITEYDLEQIMKAKGAVYAGLKTMLTQRGYSVKDLNKIYLAGGFAKYITIANAIEIGNATGPQRIDY